MSYDVGIDVGTTFTAAAICRAGAVEPVALTTSRVTVPSVVFAAGDELLFGGAAERRGASQPDGLAREFKRRVGDTVPVMLSGSPYHADRLTALMADWVLGTVAEQLGGPAGGVVFTHPANWTEYQLGTLRNALGDVGLGHAELISEPAAAAIDYAAVAQVEAGAPLLVYDLGGGTFDVALLRREGARFEHVVEPAGIERMGGIDFDEAVFQFALGKIPRPVLDAVRQQPAGAAALVQLKRRCVEAKEALSSDPAADIPVMLPDHTSTIRITRAEFEAMIRPSINQTIELVRRTIDRADIGSADLHAALLVGGSSRIPLVSQLVAEQLDVPVRVDAHPKLVTARGAARLAGTGAGRPRTGGAPKRPAAPPTSGARSRRPLLIGGVALAVVAAAVAGFLVLGGGDDDQDAGAATDPTAVGPESSTAASAPGSVTPATSPPTTPSTAAPTTLPPFRVYGVASSFSTLPGPIDVELVGNDLWVMSQDAGALQRFDITSPTPTALDTVPLGFTGAEGENGNDVVHVDGALFVTQQDAGTVARVDLAALAEPPLRIEVPGAPVNAAVLDTTVWVTVHTPVGSADPGYLVPIDTRALVIGAPLPMPQVPYGITAVGDDLWVTFDDAGQIGRVDVGTGDVQLVSDLAEPIDMVAVGDELWVAEADRDRVAVVDLATATVRQTIAVGFVPFKLAVGPDSVWVTNVGTGGAPGTVSRLERGTRDARPLQDPLQLQSAPLELAVGPDRVFVANFGSATISVLAPTAG